MRSNKKGKAVRQVANATTFEVLTTKEHCAHLFSFIFSKEAYYTVWFLTVLYDRSALVFNKCTKRWTHVHCHKRACLYRIYQLVRLSAMFGQQIS